MLIIFTLLSCSLAIIIYAPTSGIRVKLWEYLFLKRMEMEGNSTFMIKLKLKLGYVKVHDERLSYHYDLLDTVEGEEAKSKGISNLE